MCALNKDPYSGIGLLLGGCGRPASEPQTVDPSQLLLETGHHGEMMCGILGCTHRTQKDALAAWPKTYAGHLGFGQNVCELNTH